MVRRQLIEKARRDRRLPEAVNAPVGGKINARAALGPGDAHIGEASLLFEPGAATFIQRTLVGEQSLLPPRQEDRIEFETLGRMQRHDRHARARVLVIDIHHQRNMFEEPAKIGELLHGAHKLLQVLEPPGRIGRSILLPHVRVAGFLENGLGKLRMFHRVQQRGPAREIADQRAQDLARLGLQLFRLDQHARGLQQRNAFAPGIFVHDLKGRIAKAATRRVEDAFEGQIIRRLCHDAQIGQRIADFGALIKARSANHPIGKAQSDETFFEFAHLERGAHEDRHFIEALATTLQLLDLLANAARLFFRIPHTRDDGLFTILAIGEEGLSQTPFIVGNQMRRRRKDMTRRAIVALQPDDLGAWKILLEAQDVVDLGTTPPIDRLVIVTHAAHIVAALREQAQPHVLHRIRILILVDEDEAEAFLILLQHIRIVAEEAQALKQQVAEIRRIQRLQALLIHGVELAALAIGKEGRLACRNASRIKTPVLPIVDLVGELARRPALLVNVLGGDHLLQQADLVVRIENGEAGLQPHQLGMAAQHLGADGVEGA